MIGNSKRILLTGGAGFIGSHVAEALLQSGASLAIVDKLDDFYSPAWKKANLESIRQIASFDFFEQDICSHGLHAQNFCRLSPGYDHSSRCASRSSSVDRTAAAL